jgi:hypothetical protein
MAKVRRSSIAYGFSGKFGRDLVFRRLRDGQTVAQTPPDFSERVLSPEQKLHHERIKAAAAYAKTASRSNPIYARLAAGTVKNAYNLALQDWFHAPAIHCVERQGMTIRVQASDDICVAGVTIIILDEEGEIRKKGVRRQGAGEEGSGVDWWEFTPTAEGKVVVEARDWAGNVVRKEVVE